ncbi:hypothetical protein PTKIN_Ptkin04bG0238800 [Pterospermum kingtungense]
MAEPITENQNPSSGDGSSQKETLYDMYQKTLTPPSEDKSSKGRCYSFFSFFKPAGDDTSSRNKDQKPDVATTTTTVTSAAATGGVSNGDIATQNNTGEGSSSTQKKKILKTYEDPPAVRGFERDEMSLEIMLLKGGRDDTFKTIGVVGLPGVGKTTLCKSILKNERVKQGYYPRIWVSFSEKPDTEEEIVRKALEQTGVAEDISDEHKLPGLLDTLYQQLKDRKYLIVLDDVEEGEGDRCYETVKNWFSNGLPKEKGGAVIVTCRSEEAAKKMVGDRNLHRLQPLSDPTSCWLIYRDAMGMDGPDEDTPASKDVMEELLKKCGGLPGAARMMGQIKGKKMASK